MRFFTEQVLSSVPLGVVFSWLGVVIHPQPLIFNPRIFYLVTHHDPSLFFLETMGYT